MQVIYGTQYVDEIVRYERNGYGTVFVFQDANWNVTGTVNFAGDVLDRVHTKPYGEMTFDAETVNGDYAECDQCGSTKDGDIDSSDDSNFDTCNASSDPPTGACRIFDFDNDEDIDSADNVVFDSLYPGSTEIYRQPGRRTSPNGLVFAHQGLMIDEETLTYYNRHRQYNPWQQRFVQRDPIEHERFSPGFAHHVFYRDGLNLYAIVRLNPESFLDPNGTEVLVCNRPTGDTPGAIHAYFWDTRNEGQSCGQDASSGGSGGGGGGDGEFPGGDENGPYSADNPDGDCCVPIPNSAGKEDAIMGCCKEHANAGWFPIFNDCHTKVKNCGNAGGAGPPPPPPGGRFGDSEACKDDNP